MLSSDLVTGALRLIGVIASDETPSTSELATGFAVLQDLVTSWSGDELIPYATRTAAVTLANGVHSYSIPGARPLKILSAETLVAGMTFPVEVLGPDAWAAFQDKQGSNPRIRASYCDYAYPTPTVQVAPIPNTSATLNLYCLVDLPALVNSGDTFSMPEPFARALRFALAVDLAPEYGRTADPSVVATAAQTKDALKSMQASNRAGKSVLAVPPVTAPEGTAS